MPGSYTVNMHKYDVDGSSSPGNKPGGCHCSTAVGFLLTLLAIAIAVGVGIIVHFAGNEDKEIVCNCNMPTNISSGTASMLGCVSLAAQRNTEICSACSLAEATTPRLTTTDVASEQTTAMVTTAAPPSKYGLRLPTTFTPISYNVFLKPDFYSGNKSEFMFTGTSSVLVHCNENTTEIVMHQKDIHFADNSIVVTTENGVENLYESHKFVDKFQIFVISTKSMLTKGINYNIYVENYNAPIRTDFTGLYTGSYQRNNDTIYYLMSQMEVVEARKVFPCFDEPALKATFTVTIARPANMLSIFNTPLDNTSPGSDGWLHDVYQTTPIMPTYLLAIVVCDFTYLETKTANNLTVRMWGRDEAKQQFSLALDLGSRIITYFEDFFGIPFPIAKQGIIAVTDFQFGAMENWGLIMFREDVVLYLPGYSSAAAKAQIGTHISHELAHNWFGNLVSPAWWDDLWLNEGFATFMQYQGLKYAQPDWAVDELMVYETISTSMALDGLMTSHPIYISGVTDPDIILSYFDDVSYRKGSALIRMMDFFVGKDTFKRGLTNYLNALSYGNARHQDLWKHIGMQAELDNKTNSNVAEIMDTWVYQMGFPTVNVEYTETGKLRMTQSRFLLSKDANDTGEFTSEYGYKWDIPFTFTTSSERRFVQNETDIIMMNRDDGAVLIQSNKVPSPSSGNWVIGNVQYVGFFRVNYDERNWNAIMDQLSTDHIVIDPINRLQIILDSWNLARAGDLNFAIALRTLEYIGRERRYAPLNALVLELDKVDNLLYQQSIYGRFSRSQRDTFANAFNELGFSDDGSDFVLSNVRRKVTKEACYYGYELCVNKAKSIFATWMANPAVRPASLNAEVASVVYCNGVRYGGETEWNFIAEQYKMANVETDKRNLLEALTCTPHIYLLTKYGEMILDESSVSNALLYQAIKYLTKETRAQNFVWNYYRNNYDVINAKLGDFWNSVAIMDVAETFYTDLHLEELKAFGDEKNLKEFPYYIRAVAETEGRIQWMPNIEIISAWLESRGY